MSVNSGDKIDASTFTSLKSAVKSEIQRRGKTEGTAQNQSKGSLATYAGTAYDYSTTPASGVKINAEHIQKIQTPLHAANSSNASAISSGSSITATQINNALTALSKLQAIDPKSSSHGCSGSCSGLCSTGCYSGCTGCTSCSGCSGTCEGTCKSGCKTTCTRSCANDCEGGCDTECDSCGGCDSGCSSCTNCTASCADGCGGCDSLGCFPSCTDGGVIEWRDDGVKIESGNK